MAERTIVLDGFSKTYAMTGWRMGYAIVPDWLVKPFGQLIINTISGVTAFAQAGAIEALRGPQDRRRRDGRRVQGASRPHRRWAELDPGLPLRQAAGRVLRLPGHLRHGHDRRGAGGGAARGCGRVRARGHGVRRRRREPHPDLVRQLPRESAPRRWSGSAPTWRARTPAARRDEAEGLRLPDHPRRRPPAASPRRATPRSGRTSCRRRATPSSARSRAATAS